MALHQLLCILFHLVVTKAEEWVPTKLGSDAVFIEECSLGKYFWREDSPHEFYACIEAVVVETNPDYVTNAIRMTCNQGTAMCDLQDQPFHPCQCKDGSSSNNEESTKSIFNSGIASKDGVSHSKIQNRILGTTLPPPTLRRGEGFRRFGKQLGTKNFPSLLANGCPNLYRTYNNSHMFQGVSRPLSTLVSCQQGCLETRNCIGIDWNKQNTTNDTQRCFFIFPESAKFGLQPVKDYCCDHYRRTYCLSTPAGHYMTATTATTTTTAPTTSTPTTTASTVTTTRPSTQASTVSSASRPRDQNSLASDSIGTDAANSSTLIDDQTVEYDYFGSLVQNNSVSAGSYGSSFLGGYNYLGHVRLPVVGHNRYGQQHQADPKSPDRSNKNSQQDQTTPGTPETTLDSNTIPDSGCPFTYQKIVDRSHPFGKNITNGSDNDSVEKCKTWCLVRSYCLAVDFNFATSTCYFLREINNDLLIYSARVSHYQKTDCSPPLQCWMTKSTMITSAADTRVTDITMPSGECQGYCFVKQTVGSNNIIERGCETSRPANLGCFVDGTESSNFRTITCLCDTNRCNGLSVEALVSQMLYLPLDGDLTDHSGIGRNGIIPAGYSAPSFTCLDKSINCSALFMGNQCISVPSLGQNALTTIEVQPGNNIINIPKATFTVFYKRVATNTPTKQGIFGNSISPDKSPTWAIFADNLTDTSTAGVITDHTLLTALDDFRYSSAADNVWHLAVLTYNGKNQPLPTLQYFIDGNETLGNSRLENGMISVRDQPVTIGCVEGLNFVGFIDDARIFSINLDKMDIQALLAMRDSNFW